MTQIVPMQAQIATQAGAASAWSRPAAGGILMVDDHELVRLGFRALLKAHAPVADSSIQVFEAQNLAEALALYEFNEPAIGVVLLDLALPDSQGLAGLITFRKRFPAARIVVLSGTGDKSLAQGALALGAMAFLSKSGDLAEVLRFIHERGVFHGLAAGAAWPADGRGRTAGAAELKQELTARQLQMLEWILAGKSNREIARVANLSEGTVKNHVSTLLLLFGMRSRAQLISGLR